MSEHMCVTVCTRERPQMLMACLKSVLPQLEASDVKTSLVVVENDSEPKNKQAVLDLSDHYPSVQVEYRLEIGLGIPLARNTAVETALELGADWVFFIDDDEEACEGWFAAYLDAFAKWDADIFRGPVRYVYPETQPDWLRLKSFDGGSTGSPIKTAITNNLAMSAEIFSISGLGLRFDNRLRFTGGSDVALSRQATAKGATIRWIREAEVLEKQYGRRLTKAWLLERTERVAATDIAIIASQGSQKAALRLATARCPRLVLQAALKFLLIPAVAWRPAQMASIYYAAICKLFRARGLIRGLSGRLPSPYAS